MILKMKQHHQNEEQARNKRGKRKNFIEGKSNSKKKSKYIIKTLFCLFQAKMKMRNRNKIPFYYCSCFAFHPNDKKKLEKL